MYQPQSSSVNVENYRSGYPNGGDNSGNRQYVTRHNNNNKTTKTDEDYRRSSHGMMWLLRVLSCILGLVIVAAILAVILLAIKQDDDNNNNTMDDNDTSGASSKAGTSLTPAPQPNTSPTSTGTSGGEMPIPATPPAPMPTLTKTNTWQKVGGPFPSASSDLAVSLVDGGNGNNYLAIGEPLVDRGAVGNVLILDRSTGWGIDQPDLSDEATGQFGFSLASAVIGGTPSLLVGATHTQDDPGSIDGSVHFYQRDRSGKWNTLPPSSSRGLSSTTVRPNFDLSENNGRFGYSVALASTRLRIAVGAPETTIFSAGRTGRVYTYDYDAAAARWTPMADPLVGFGAGRRFGTSVAMSRDGSRLLVGSPGHMNGNGAVRYYEWSNDGSRFVWKDIFTFPGSAGEGLGTTVAIVSDDGRRIAFGGPSFNGDRGIVPIFEESTFFKGFFDRIKDPDIVGGFGDRVGATLCGGSGRVAFGTARGSFSVYERNSVSWELVATGPSFSSAVVSITCSHDVTLVAVALENQSVVVYDLA